MARPEVVDDELWELVKSLFAGSHATADGTPRVSARGRILC
jgi:hypothetical protein